MFLIFYINGKPTLMGVKTEASLMSQLEVAKNYGALLEFLSVFWELRLVSFFFG